MLLCPFTCYCQPQRGACPSNVSTRSWIHVLSLHMFAFRCVMAILYSCGWKHHSLIQSRTLKNFHLLDRSVGLHQHTPSFLLERGFECIFILWSIAQGTSNHIKPPWLERLRPYEGPVFALLFSSADILLSISLLLGNLQEQLINKW